MPDTNLHSENPYAAPQLAQAELVLAVEPSQLGPGELPCHRCGQPVSVMAGECPSCNAGPLYDGLELLVTAFGVCAVIAGGGVLLHFFVPQFEDDLGAIFLVVGMVVSIAVVVPPVRAVFQKLRRGRW
jgi:hypothetical protein